ncbi:MAG: hypothetical protein ACFWT6_10980 [Virgibacillus proomii]
MITDFFHKIVILLLDSDNKKINALKYVQTLDKESYEKGSLKDFLDGE